MNLKNANLKNILNFKELEKLFRNYANTSGLDVALYDLNGEEQLCVRKNDSICNLIKDVSAGNGSRSGGAVRRWPKVRIRRASD